MVHAATIMVDTRNALLPTMQQVKNGSGYGSGGRRGDSGGGGEVSGGSGSGNGRNGNTASSGKVLLTAMVKVTIAVMVVDTGHGSQW